MGDELPLSPPDTATIGRRAVIRLRLADAAVLGLYEPLAEHRPICFNDLALGPSGDVFLTAGSDGLWRLRRGGDSLERLITAHLSPLGLHRDLADVELTGELLVQESGAA
jgi:hypothetical protein